MCIIIVVPPGQVPDYENLLQATYENEDGSGWMMRTPQGIEIVRSAKSIDHVVSTFWEARKRWPNSWAVWHSRLATHGYIDDANTHPFIVPGTHWAMVHNGILPLSDGPFRSDRSDSRIFAEDHLPTQTWAELKAGKKDIEHWLMGDKVVLMSGRKEKGGPVIIFNEDRGKWDADNCWYSHPLYWPKYRALSPSLSKMLDEDDEYAEFWEQQDMTEDDLEKLADAEEVDIYADVFADEKDICDACAANLMGVDQYATECPYCLTHFSGGIIFSDCEQI